MSDYFVHETAIVEEGARIGANTKIWHHAHVRSGAVIGDDVSIGKGAYVDIGVTIGNRVRIQNGVSIYKGVSVEDDVFLGPHCNFTNDLFPRANSSEWEVVPTRICKGASIGANASIVCGVTIGRYSLISVGAVVTQDTLPFSLMVGHPARLKDFVCACGRKLTRTLHEALVYTYRCEACGKKLSITFALTEHDG
jgi:UDP-3-O-[3-hydroxymyristoyl] glucosamine N-acyltransferase